MKTMDNLICFSLTFLSICKLLVNVNVVVTAADTGVSGTPKEKPLANITAACDMTFDKAFCVNSLTRNSQSKGLDLKSLGLLALQTAQQKGQEVYPSLLKKEKSISSAEDEALKDCPDYYKTALGNIQSCLDLFQSTDIPYNDMRSNLNVALMNGKVCRRQLINAKLPADNQLKISSDNFVKWCDNAISIIIAMQNDALRAGTADTFS